MKFLIVLVITLFVSGILGRSRGRARSGYINCTIPTLKNGFVDVRLNGRYIQFGCSPGFLLYGMSMSSCVYGQWENHVPICVASGCEKMVTPPNGTIAFYKFGAKLTCHSRFELVGNDEAFCDGTNWDRQIGSCRETNIASPLFCDFEGYLKCGWQNYISNEKNWIQKNMGRHGTGPQHDHTKMKKFEGFFMVLEGYGPPYPRRLYLFSPMYSSEISNNSCFKFYYHMYGVTPGKIRIYVKSVNQTNSDFMAKYISRTTALLEISNRSSNAWIEALVPLPMQTGMFQIVIQGELMYRQRTDVAIDDVEILNGAACDADRATITERPTDEPGGIYDVQSCQYNCGGIMTTPSTKNILKCNCYYGCADDDTCCPDFEQFCVFEETTTISHIYHTNTTTNSPTTTTTASTTSTVYPSTTRTLYMNNDSRSVELLLEKYDQNIAEDTSGATWLITCIIISMIAVVGGIAGFYVYRERTKRASTVVDMKKHYHCKSATDEFSEIGILTDDDDSSSLSGNY